VLFPPTQMRVEATAFGDGGLGPRSSPIVLARGFHKSKDREGVSFLGVGIRDRGFGMGRECVVSGGRKCVEERLPCLWGVRRVW